MSQKDNFSDSHVLSEKKHKDKKIKSPKNVPKISPARVKLMPRKMKPLQKDPRKLPITSIQEKSNQNMIKPRIGMVNKRRTG